MKKLVMLALALSASVAFAGDQETYNAQESGQSSGQVSGQSKGQGKGQNNSQGQGQNNGQGYRGQSHQRHYRHHHRGHRNVYPYSLGMSCAQAQNIVASNGAAVIVYGDGLYDRFVAHQGYCMRDEATKPAWIPTADDDTCFVGYTCAPGNGGND